MADHIFAFARVQDDKAVIAAVTRCPSSLQMEQDMPLVSQAAWNETAVLIPRSLAGRLAGGVLDAEWSRVLPERLPAGELLGRLPVVALEV